jgi:hypothetical protein
MLVFLFMSLLLIETSRLSNTEAKDGKTSFSNYASKAMLPITSFIINASRVKMKQNMFT